MSVLSHLSVFGLQQRHKELQASPLQESQGTVQWAKEDCNAEGCKEKSAAVSTPNPMAKENINVKKKKKHIQHSLCGLWTPRANNPEALLPCPTPTSALCTGAVGTGGGLGRGTGMLVS